MLDILCALAFVAYLWCNLQLSLESKYNPKVEVFFKSPYILWKRKSSLSMLLQMFNSSLTNWSRVVGGIDNILQICLKSRQNGFLQNVGQLGFTIPSRNTFVFQRKHKLRLMKKGNTKINLKKNAYIYDVVEHSGSLSKKSEKINVILTTYIKGLGQQGECVAVNKNYGYTQLLLPGLADYATPENIQRWKTIATENCDEKTYSSIHVERTLAYLASRTFDIVMNKETEWTLQPWHVRVSLRKAGVHLMYDCIELPPQKIEGPNMDIEGKIFNINLTINKTEKVKIRCRIHHWATNPIDRLPFVQDHWLQPAENLFSEDTIKTLS